MISRYFFRSFISLSFALALVPVLANAQTTEPANVYLMSSLLNFTRGQAVSLNFTNVDRVARTASMHIVDAAGNRIWSANWLVQPGRSVSLIGRYNEVSPRFVSSRLPVRGVVFITDGTISDIDPPDPDLALATIDVFDENSGKSLIGLLLPAIRSTRVFLPEQ